MLVFGGSESVQVIAVHKFIRTPIKFVLTFGHYSPQKFHVNLKKNKTDGIERESGQFGYISIEYIIFVVSNNQTLREDHFVIILKR